MNLLGIRLRSDLEEAKQERVKQWLEAIPPPQQGTIEDPVVIQASDSESDEESGPPQQPLPILEQVSADLSSRRFRGAHFMDPNPGLTRERVAALHGETALMDTGRCSTQSEDDSSLWSHLLAIERDFIMESLLRQPGGPHTPPYHPSHGQ